MENNFYNQQQIAHNQQEKVVDVNSNIRFFSPLFYPAGSLSSHQKVGRRVMMGCNTFYKLLPTIK